MSRIGELIAQYCPDAVEFKTLRELFGNIPRGKRLTKSSLAADGSIPVFHGGLDPVGLHDRANTPGKTVMIINTGASSGTVGWSDVPFWCSDGCFSLPHSEAVLARFLYHYALMNHKFFVSKVRRAGIPTLAADAVLAMRIPVPPIEVQREIVRILDAFTMLETEVEAELEARRQQYEYYRKELLSLPGVTFQQLGDIASNFDHRRQPVTRDARVPGDIPYYGASGVVDYVSDYIFDGDYLLVSEDGANLLARSTSIAFSISGKAWVNNHAHVLEFNSYAERRFVELYLNSIDLTPYISGSTQPKLNRANLNKIAIPAPSLEKKEEIVDILDKFEALISDPSAGLRAELDARRKQYEYYRDKLLTFEDVRA